MEDRWLAWAKQLQAIASTGQSFCKDEFDQERYREIAHIANSMIAQLGTVPIERIEGLVSDFAKGYATPKVDVRGAVIEKDKILLVRERSDGCWTLPGGFADVGRSASENVVKEIWEEAGIAVSARSLYSVRHKAKQPYQPDARDFYKLFFICERTDLTAPSARGETTDVDFFPADRLPRLSRGRVVESDIEAAFAFQHGSLHTTIFD
ncbi:NUDIX hydrolase [Rhodopseudomonas sp. BR0C11]|uniref:NUDIX hydrolase n=1 Tax=Rhodopseudomonas sp. BR0C11 TaxID=2269370 RepID=UPI0013E09C37|nr:NUDIX hydrolase [Rhodopseudomonas sp. BR0C11]NEV77420.1 NUDIX hydrolase [Rhodopseudomonas sp. BR0C11]